jgi:hypothetical protein
MAPKAGAAHAAAAAGKKRQAALEISAAQEDRVREALKASHNSLAARPASVAARPHV